MCSTCTCLHSYLFFPFFLNYKSFNLRDQNIYIHTYILIPDFYVHDIQVIIAVTLLSGSECWIWSKCHFCLVFYLNVYFTPQFMRNNLLTESRWPNECDRKICAWPKRSHPQTWAIEVDRKRTTTTKMNGWIWPNQWIKSHFRVSVIFMGISVMFRRLCLSV